MKYILLIIAAIFFATPSFADWINEEEKPLEQIIKDAQAGSAVDQYNLGVMYTNDDKVKKDFEEAVKWLKLSAEQNYPKAQATLGALYNLGESVPQDFEKALKWSKLAAENGEASAQTTLGVMYGLGQGVPQDFEKALMWLIISSSNGEKSGIEFKEFIKGLMPMDQINKAQDMAKNWKPKAKK